MKRIKFFGILVAIITLSYSCASIVSRTKWPLTINTNPSGANVAIVDKHGVQVYSGTTPVTTKLKSGDGFFAMQSYQVKISLAGYNDKVIPVSCKLNGWYIGNIFIGGLIGWLIVDPATGAMWRLDTEMINETLVKPTTSSIDDKTIKILTLKDIPDSWKGHLVQVN